MARPQPLERRLLFVVLASLVFVAAIVQLASSISRHAGDVQVEDQLHTETLQQLATIRERILQQVGTLRLPAADPITGSNDWLAPLLTRITADDEAVAYAMIVSPDGVVLAHSDPREVDQSLPIHIHKQITLTRGRQSGQVELDAWFGRDRLVDHAVPIMVDGQRVGSAHVGTSVPVLQQRQADQRWAADRVLWVAGALCLLVIVGGGVVAWWMIRHARQWDEEDARRDHLAGVGKLAGGLVHEIRNPLNAMRMQIAVMRTRLKRSDETQADGLAEQLTNLESEVLRLQGLATNFLAYGRPPADKLEELSVAKFVGDVAEFILPEFEQQGMRIQREIDPQAEGLTVLMDRGKLRQVLLNLTENARHAMKAGGVLTFGLGREVPHELCLTVEDTGCGMSQEQLERIFDAFFSTKDDGNGLGLAIARQIIESAGGRIAVRSQVGQGTCFTIHLPLTSSAQRRQLEAATAATPGEAAP